MRKFRVHVPTRFMTVFEVEASTQEEAIEKMNRNEADPVEDRFVDFEFVDDRNLQVEAVDVELSDGTWAGMEYVSDPNLRGDMERRFVTNDGKSDVTHEADEKARRDVEEGDYVTINSKEALLELARAAGEVFDHTRESVKDMTREEAEEVRRLRCDLGYTWRAVAAEIDRQKDCGWGSNQLFGMALCEKAAEFFGEDYRQSPWN